MGDLVLEERIDNKKNVKLFCHFILILMKKTS